MEENLVPYYLPKAGEVCEAKHVDGRMWYNTEIMYIDKYCVVYRIDGKATSIHRNLDYLTFRKIKTGEEKFVEAYINARGGSNVHMFENVAKELYQAGFRYVGEES